MKNENKNKKGWWNICFRIILLVTVSASCQNKHESTDSNEEYYINSEGDTMMVTITLGDTIYRTTNYRISGGKKIKSKVIHHLEDVTPHGKSIVYHSNGQLKSVVEFKNGKIWEVNKYMDSAGNNLDYGYIDKGEGYLKKYYVDLSILEEEGNVKDGYKDGYWIQYCGNGVKVCDSTLYEKGKDDILKEIGESLPVHQSYK